MKLSLYFGVTLCAGHVSSVSRNLRHRDISCKLQSILTFSLGARLSCEDDVFKACSFEPDGSSGCVSWASKCPKRFCSLFRYASVSCTSRSEPVNQDRRPRAMLCCTVLVLNIDREIGEIILSMRSLKFTLRHTGTTYARQFKLYNCTPAFVVKKGK